VTFQTKFFLRKNLMPTIKIPAKMENLEQLLKFIANFAGNEGFSDERVMEIRLSCEEALVNIFHYAYPAGKQGDVEVDCKAGGKNDVVVEMIDTGQRFDATTIPNPDINESISKRRVGGLGGVLIKKFVDEIDYQWHQNKNYLRFKFFKPD